MTKRDFAQPLESSGGTAVAGGHVGFQEQQVVVRLAMTQTGNPFGGFPVLHLRVVHCLGVSESVPIDRFLWESTV